MSPPSAIKSVFVSHTNDDSLAEIVLNQIQTAFEKTPLPDGLSLVVDRCSIAPGETWRERIYEWLENCPIAIVLISPDSFCSKKPWVAREAYYLAVRRSVRKNVLVIPVLLGNVKELLKKEPDFEPANTSETAWIECVDPRDEAARTAVIEEIRETIKTWQRRNPQPVSIGLENGIAAIFSSNREALETIATKLGMDPGTATVQALAIELLQAPEEILADALSAFSAHMASKRGARKVLDDICALVAARGVPDAAARQLRIEMTKSPNIARPVLLNCTENSVTRLYSLRSSSFSDREWRLLDAKVVLETTLEQDMRCEFKKVLLLNLLDDKARIASERDEIAKQTAEFRRRVGRPVVFHVNIADADNAGSLVQAWRDAVPDCGLLLRQKAPWNPVVVDAEEPICRLEPQLNKAQCARLMALYSALKDICGLNEEN